MKTIVDLRSDTVTKPDAGMREALASAEVGDDVLGDDPTVLRLQERSAALLGKEAALFVPSGTMANQIAIRVATTPGDEVICDDSTHSYHYETGATSALAGCQVRLLHGPRGIFTAADVAAAVRPPDSHFPRSRMLIVENTNNRGGGAVWPLAQLAEVCAEAERHGLHRHLDGARLMNAAVAQGLPATDITKHVDTVSMCFSKGLGAPVGSIVAGSKAFIAAAHRTRKMFGGGMRQVGILAAAAEYALDHNLDRLAEDHANARRLAEGLAALPGITLDPASVDTNIVIFDVAETLGTAAAFVGRLADEGVWMFAIGPRRVRAVTHLGVAAEMIERALEEVGNLTGRAAIA